MIQDCRIRLCCIAIFGLAFSGGAANCFGDIETFWKTTTCPTFGGLKPPIAFEVGVMEAVMNDPAIPNSFGVGGLYCRLLSSPPNNVPSTSKFLTTSNAAVVAPSGNQWNCVVCQYENKIGMPVPPEMTLPIDYTNPDSATVRVSIVGPAGGIPAVSFLGTVVLMAGLVVAGVYAIKQRKVAAGAN